MLEHEAAYGLIIIERDQATIDLLKDTISFFATITIPYVTGRRPKTL